MDNYSDLEIWWPGPVNNLLGGEINMIFKKEQIWSLYEDNSKQAIKKLEEIEVFCGGKPKFSGLNGWVFEKTILYCIRAELNKKI